MRISWDIFQTIQLFVNLGRSVWTETVELFALKELQNLCKKFKGEVYVTDGDLYSSSVARDINNEIITHMTPCGEC